ncbi:hypothetical protein [Hathewaya massiliensis]|uniref:hypothetical protein n=1 Tax=Hathewaya massiliensis TaxID=1964382 RepID=UPI00115AA6BD|nr:hypothetical protein [Hathewaya massiliensis]
MEYTFNTKSCLNWNAKGKERIVQNVSNILNTHTHEVAYNRNLGRDSSNIDLPIDMYVSKIIEETFDLIEENEPRALIKDIEYLGLENNIPILKVVIEVGD